MHPNAMEPPNVTRQTLMACLSDPSRYRLVRALARGPRCGTELASDVGLSQSCTARHLQALQHVGLVRGERDGKRVVFRLRTGQSAVADLVRWALDDADVVGDEVPAGLEEEVLSRVARVSRSSRDPVEAQPEPVPGGTGAMPMAKSWSRPGELEDFLL
jgi:DNA-binding transcriptional ArsR family regulator